MDSEKIDFYREEMNDRDDEEYELDAIQTRDVEQSLGSQDSLKYIGNKKMSLGGNSEVTGNTNFDELEALKEMAAAEDFESFKEQMVAKFGEETFEEGYELIKDKQNLIFDDNGEDELVQLLTPLFKDVDSCRGFINFCTTYLIVQNMNYDNK